MDVCNAILIEQDDNVAVVIEAVAQDERISYYQGNELKSLHAAETIPLYHKVAVRKILKGENIIKYGRQMPCTPLPMIQSRCFLALSASKLPSALKGVVVTA